MNSEQPSGSLWSRFWFTPIPTTGLQVLRVLSGLLFSFWLLSFLGHQEGFFSLTGWFDLQGYESVQRQGQQEALAGPIDWSLLYIAGESRATFQVLYWFAVAVMLLFTLGVATRIMGICVWLLVVSFLANPAASFEGDYLLGVLAFHLMIGHLLLGQWNGNLSIAERILGSKDDFLFRHWLFPRKFGERPMSHAANFSLRLLQIHVAIIIVTSGLHKLQMGDWWSGAALWYALHPPFQTTLETLQRQKTFAPTMMFWVSLIQYAVLAWQIAFPVFAWRRGVFARTILLGGAALGWVGALYLFKLPLFGPFVFIGALSFLSPDEWAWLKNRVGSMFQASAETKAERETARTAIKR